MTTAALLDSKGKGEAREDQPSSSESSDSDDLSSEASPESDSDSEDDISQEYLDSLLEKAKHEAAAKAKADVAHPTLPSAEEDLIELEKEPEEQALPKLDPGELPPSYFTFKAGLRHGFSSARDLDVEAVEQALSSYSAPAPPVRPPETVLTKKEKKALKQQTAGPSWFDLPAPSEADLPRMYREVEALRLRNQLDPKRFYKKDEGEGKGIKGLPKHFAIGTIIPSTTPFGTASGDNLKRASRKRTLVDELVDDAEAKHYAKKKFQELQSVRGARGRGTLAQKQAMRRRKW